MSDIYRDRILQAMNKDAQEQKWDVVMLRLGHEDRAWAWRCLPMQFIDKIKKNYTYGFSIPNQSNKELAYEVFVTKSQESLIKVLSDLANS